MSEPRDLPDGLSTFTVVDDKGVCYVALQVGEITVVLPSEFALRLAMSITALAVQADTVNNPNSTLQ